MIIISWFAAIFGCVIPHAQEIKSQKKKKIVRVRYTACEHNFVFHLTRKDLPPLIILIKHITNHLGFAYAVSCCLRAKLQLLPLLFLCVLSLHFTYVATQFSELCEYFATQGKQHIPNEMPNINGLWRDKSQILFKNEWKFVSRYFSVLFLFFFLFYFFSLIAKSFIHFIQGIFISP